jgi:Gram-negative porin
MRKYLLAGVAMLGAATAMQGSAYAQTAPAPAMPLMQPQMNTLIVPNGGKSANDNNNYQPAPLPGAVANPTPGSMVIRLNGKIWTEYGFGSGTGLVIPGTGKNSVNGGLGTYFRLYPGFDAQATNGLQYGGQVEIRENFIAAASNTGNTGLSGLTCGQTLYVRRDFVWVSNPAWGLFRLGQGDGVSGIFDNGIISQQGYGQGGWNGDASAWVANSGDSVAFPWFSQQGAEYGSNKIVYLSPQFFGIDVGLEYAPNNGNIETGASAATTGSSPLVSSASAPDGTRYIDLFQVGARYQGVVGPVAIYGFADYIGSGTVSYTGTAASALDAAFGYTPAGTKPTNALPGSFSLASGGTNPTTLGSKYNGKFKNLSVGFVGAEFTIGGLAIGGGWQGGAYNSPSTSMGTEPEGGVGSNLYGFGALYTIGALSFGASWYGYDSQGAVGLAGLSQRHENGLGLGINYTIAPGINPYLEALYGTRHQGGYDFVNGKYFSQTGYEGNNTVWSDAIIVGIQVGW